MKKTPKGDVFVYEVMAAILSNLHILKKMLKVSRLAPTGFGISTFIIMTRNNQKT